MYTIPKYTYDELCRELNTLLLDSSCIELSIKKRVPYDTLLEISRGIVRPKLLHYEILSKVLDIPLEELLSSNMVKLPTIQTKGLTDTEKQEIDARLSVLMHFFVDAHLLKRQSH